jgi:AcrR family transcriptional regulator
MIKEYANKEPVIKILAVAEELFCNRGYHDTSIRDVTRRAGVNLAAINYHFGDKQSLYCAVLASRLRPVNRTRLDNLTSALDRAGDQPIPLALIIDIFARPMFDLCQDRTNGGTHAIRLIGRSIMEPFPFVDDLLAKELHPVTTRFSQVLRRHVPTLTAEEFMWRLNFAVGAMHHTLATMHRLKDLTRGLCRNNDAPEALRHFTQFAVTTITAPVA